MAASKLGDSWQDLQYSPFFCIFHDSDRTHCDTQLELITAAAAAYMEHKGGSAIRIRRPSCQCGIFYVKMLFERFPFRVSLSQRVSVHKASSIF